MIGRVSALIRLCLLFLRLGNGTKWCCVHTILKRKRSRTFGVFKAVDYPKLTENACTQHPGVHHKCPSTRFRPLYPGTITVPKFWRGYFKKGCDNISELKQQRRRRLRKRHLKSEFALPQTLSRLFQLV